MKYSVLYLLGLTLPYVHFMFLIWVVFEIFTPIMGRSGTEIPPEVVMATLVTLATIFISSFFVSIPTQRTAKDIHLHLYDVFVITLESRRRHWWLFTRERIHVTKPLHCVPAATFCLSSLLTLVV